MRGSRFTRVAAALLLALAIAVPLHSSERTLKVHFIDVGQGDSTLVRTPAGRFILIDGGGDAVRPDGSVSDPGKEAVIPFLEKQGVREIEAVVISHAHPDHCGGLRAVLKRFPVKAVYETGFHADEDREYLESREIMKARRIPQRIIRPGDKPDWDPALRVDVLGPPDWGKGRLKDPANNNSLVIKIAYGKTSFLFTGDAEMEEESRLVKTWGPSLASDVLKCPHHGSYTSSSEGFVETVRPKFAVISCALYNDFDHPHGGILARYRRHKVTVLRTDYDGTVTLSSDGAKIARE